MSTRLHRLMCAALEANLAGGKPRPPEGAGILWGAFLALSRTRTCGPTGPNPISFSEIEAWARLTRTPLEPRHVETLVEMDRLWMERAYARQDAPEGVKQLPQRSEHGLTPKLFDLAVG